jgi:hypothetical protein
MLLCAESTPEDSRLTPFRMVAVLYVLACCLASARRALLTSPMCDVAVAVCRGKTILVTGATDGTGFHCARAFAQHGARVIIHGRNEDKARRYSVAGT